MESRETRCRWWWQWKRIWCCNNNTFIIDWWPQTAYMPIQGGKGLVIVHPWARAECLNDKETPKCDDQIFRSTEEVGSYRMAPREPPVDCEAFLILTLAFVIIADEEMNGNGCVRFTRLHFASTGICGCGCHSISLMIWLFFGGNFFLWCFVSDFFGRIISRFSSFRLETFRAIIPFIRLRMIRQNFSFIPMPTVAMAIYTLWLIFRSLLSSRWGKEGSGERRWWRGEDPLNIAFTESSASRRIQVQ